MGNWGRTTLLLATLSAILMLVGSAMGGSAGLVLAFVLAVAMNLSSYWFSDRLILRMYRATEVEDGHPLDRLVAELALRAGLPKPRVYTIDNDSPNAFATGRDPEHGCVAATTGLLAILDEEELRGVMAHELGHVANRDILVQSVAATIGAAIMFLASMARWAAIFGVGGRGDRDGGSPLALLATALVAPLAAMIVQAAISRAREFGADEAGARIAGQGEGLARALEKIESAVSRVPLAANPATAHLFIMQPFAGRGRGRRGLGMTRLFSTHPPTAERVARLRTVSV